MRYLIIPLLFLSGCWTSNRQEQEATTRTTDRVGIERGQPTQITETVVERKTIDSQAQSGVDVGKAVAAGMAAVKGDIMGAIASMKPADPPRDSGLDGTTGGLMAGAVSLGIIALREWAAKRAAAKDAEEGWQKAQEAHKREVEMAKQLPPPAQDHA